MIYILVDVSLYVFGRWWERKLDVFFPAKKAQDVCRAMVLCQNRDTLASRGLEEPAHASRGLEELFLQLCSFWFWQEIGFGFTYYLPMSLGYRTIQLWCCVSFFGSGGK